MIPEARPETFVVGQTLTRSAVEYLSLVQLVADTLTQSGTTAQRPSTRLWVGRFYYDTTIGLPIWVSAVTPSIVWKDAAGNTV